MLKVVVTPQTLASFDPQMAGSEPIELQLRVSSRLLPLLSEQHAARHLGGDPGPGLAALGMQQWRRAPGVGQQPLDHEGSCSVSPGLATSKVKEGLNEFSFLP